MEVKIIAIDCDGVLTKDVCWTVEDCEKAQPNVGIIKWVNKMQRGNFIVVFTARRDELIPATIQWLRRHNVRFDAISNNKMAADCYIDDKSYNPIRRTMVWNEEKIK